jgi:hypothetical protein
MKRSGPRVSEHFHDSYLATLGKGLSIVIWIAILIGFTVHFWSVMWTVLGMLAGLRTTIQEIRTGEARAAIGKPRQPMPASRTVPTEVIAG